MRHKTQRTTVEKRKEAVSKYNNSPERKAKLKEYYQNNKERWKKYTYEQYGITKEIYEAMLESQNNSCYTCGVHINDSGAKGLCIDHCHETNKVRGLLCSPCNTALGLLKEDIEVMKKLIGYVERNNASSHSE